LKDLANRQGLEENDYYDLFTQIITLGIEEFEWFRQDIVRKVAVLNDDQSESVQKSFVDEVLENPKVLLNMTPENLKTTIAKIKSEKKEKKRIESRRKEELDSLYYDIRMLNSLSTIGLKSSSIAHELGNDKNFLYEFYGNVSSTLKEHGLWDDLRNSREFSKNIPKLLDKNEKISKKLIRFLETNLELIELDIFDKKKINFHDILLEIKERWQTDYKFIDIKITEEGSPSNINFYEDILNVIFDNLILNSVQQNNKLASLSIEIVYEITLDKIKITYKDSGKGLAVKYKENTFRILQPHESTRRKSGGHGLGMWIVKNTISYTKGNVLAIENPPGFTFIFELGRFE
jgi:signal transduction histidine kinase